MRRFSVIQRLERRPTLVTNQTIDNGFDFKGNLKRRFTIFMNFPYLGKKKEALRRREGQNTEVKISLNKEISPKEETLLYVKTDRDSSGDS